jgi:hypothetical protein
MGCNCGKNRKSVAQVQAEQAKVPQPNQQSTTAATQNPPAPKGKTQSFALKMNDGRVLRFGSRLEAEAENVRRGYTGTVRPA